jgi:hypothetical protein
MVWIEEIDRKISKLVRDFIRITDEDGKSNPVKIVYSEAEGEGELPINEELPLITLKLYDLRLDKSRITNPGLKIKVNSTTDTVSLKNYPLPYWLLYEITITTEFQQDIIAIETQLQSILSPRGELLVPDSQTNEDTSLFIELIQYLKPKVIEAEKTKTEERKRRRLKSVLRYRITAELDSNNIEEYFKVKEVHVESQQQQQITVIGEIASGDYVAEPNNNTDDIIIIEGGDKNG